MTAPIARAVLPLVTLALLAGCGRTAPPPAPLPALQRPLVTTAIRDGRVLAPQAAVVERGGLPGVFVVTDGVARFRMVRTGKVYDGRIEILSGLTGGEQIVAADLREIHDGSPVEAKPSTDERR
jgi:hypothetical protein